MKTDLIKLSDKISMSLAKLIATKLFIYANSGFGKSWLLRRIIEQCFGKIQQIIIDPEGEFSTLREKYDFILIGKGKDFDIQADPRSAALLAHRLLQEKVSAIIDLYELEPLERERFVANFTTALVNVPKELQHPYLYIVDEAQDFAPEKGDALSSKALHSIAKKGRKRGCCPIFATQRVSDFSKAVIAACNNKLIGQASLDIDMKRCAAELGFSSKEQILSLRDLEPGEFFAFGPAISKIVQKIKVGPVFTSHPDSSKFGAKIGSKVVPASARVKKALAKMTDLPQEAIEEARTLAEYKQQVSTLTRQLRERPVEKAVPVAMGVSQWFEYGKKYGYDSFFIKKFRDAIYPKLLKSHGNATRALVDLLKDIEAAVGADKNANIGKFIVVSPEVFKLPTPKGFDISSQVVKNGLVGEEASTNGQVGKGEMVILKAVAGEPEGMTIEHVAVATGYKESSRRIYLQKLVAAGLVDKRGDMFIATQAGVEALGNDYEPAVHGSELRARVLQRLPEGERKILEVLIAAYPDGVTDAEVEQATGYKESSRRIYTQKLVSRKVARSEKKTAYASDRLFD